MARSKCAAETPLQESVLCLKYLMPICRAAEVSTTGFGNAEAAFGEPTIPQLPVRGLSVLPTQFRASPKTIP